MSPESRRTIFEPSQEERDALLDSRIQQQITVAVGPRTADFFENLQVARSPRRGGIPEVGELVNRVWEVAPERGMEPERKADYIIEQLPRAATALLLPENPDFIRGIYWPEFWERMTNSMLRMDFILYTMLPIMSNKYERGKVIDLELKAHGFWKDNIALELGAGGNQIGKNLLIRDPYPHTTVMEWVRRNGHRTVQENPNHSQLINEGIALHLPFSFIVGVDLHNPEDPMHKNSRLACSLTLDERTDPEKVREITRLDVAKPKNIVWQWGDIVDYTPDEYRKEFPGKSLPNITYASYVLYLLKKERQRQGLKNMADFAIQSGGIALALDDISSIDANHMPQIVRRQRDFSSTSAWVFNGKRPEAGWIKHFSIRTGRVDAIILEPAFEDMYLEDLYKAIAKRR